MVQQIGKCIHLENYSFYGWIHSVFNFLIYFIPFFCCVSLFLMFSSTVNSCQNIKHKNQLISPNNLNSFYYFIVQSFIAVIGCVDSYIIVFITQSMSLSVDYQS